MPSSQSCGKKPVAAKKSSVKKASQLTELASSGFKINKFHIIVLVLLLGVLGAVIKFGASAATYSQREMHASCSISGQNIDILASVRKFSDGTYRMHHTIAGTSQNINITYKGQIIAGSTRPYFNVSGKSQAYWSPDYYFRKGPSDRINYSVYTQYGSCSGTLYSLAW